MLTVDAHHHLWDRTRQDFQYSWLDSQPMLPISNSFLPSDLKPLMDAAGIGKSIVVQTQHDIKENDWALELASQNEFIAGVVGWVDLRSDRCEAQVEHYKAAEKFIGVRHVVQDEPDDFIIGSEVLRGLAVLQEYKVPYDLLFYVRQLKHTVTVAKQLPELPLVLDHLGKPDIKGGGYATWLPLIQQAAACPNVYCKLSGLVTEANWTHWTVDDLRPYVLAAIECFGPSRCMFGSDWPVSLLAAKYSAVCHSIQTILCDLTEGEQAEVFGQTANRFYQLGL